jgi:hypothetical protein
VAFPENFAGALAHEEVEVGALVGLEDVVDIQTVPAALEVAGRLRGLPLTAAAGEFGVVDVEVQVAAGAVDFDLVAFLTSASGPPASASGRRAG